MGIFFRKLAIVCLLTLAFTESAFAATYYWTKGNSATVPQYASAVSACPATIIAYNLTFTFNGLLFYSPSSATCKYRYTDAQGQNSDELRNNLSRYGDSCPVNNTYDNVIGGCVMPPPPELEPGELCADQTGATAQNPYIWDPDSGSSGACEKFFDAEDEASCAYMGANSDINTPTSYTVAGVMNSAGQAVAPPTFAATALSCTAATISSSECTINVAGAISCNVMATFTGGVNGGDVDAQDALCGDGLGACPDQEPQITTTEEPCVPVSNGSGGTSCTTEKKTEAEGTQNCGLVNGTYTCVTRLPRSNGLTTNISSTSQTLANGSVEVTTVKDSSNEVCTDVGTCTTKHSVTVTKTTTTTSGGTSTTASCTGICTPTGGGVETLPTAGVGSSGPGTGGNGTGDGEGEGSEEGNAAIAPSCAAAPFCDGDPFQCAVLKQAHLDTCRLMANPTAEETAATDAKINTAWAAYDANQATLDAQTSTLYSQFQGAVSGGGGGGVCLADVPFAVMGHSMVMEFSRVCEYIEFIRYGVLAVAYLLAARIVMREDH